MTNYIEIENIQQLYDLVHEYPINPTQINIKVTPPNNSINENSNNIQKLCSVFITQYKSFLNLFIQENPHFYVEYSSIENCIKQTENKDFISDFYITIFIKNKNINNDLAVIVDKYYEKEKESLEESEKPKIEIAPKIVPKKEPKKKVAPKRKVIKAIKFNNETKEENKKETPKVLFTAKKIKKITKPIGFKKTVLPTDIKNDDIHEDGFQEEDNKTELFKEAIQEVYAVYTKANNEDIKKIKSNLVKGVLDVFKLVEDFKVTEYCIITLNSLKSSGFTINK